MIVPVSRLHGSIYIKRFLVHELVLVMILFSLSRTISLCFGLHCFFCPEIWGVIDRIRGSASLPEFRLVKWTFAILFRTVSFRVNSDCLARVAVPDLDSVTVCSG